MTRDQDVDLYESHVLRHFEEPHRQGSLPAATHSQRVDNPMCGDSVTLFLVVDSTGRIHQAGFLGSGCIISQAAASMLAQAVEGRSLEDLGAFSPADMLQLFRVPLTARRQQCCLLAWRALRTLLDSLPSP